MEVSGAWTRPPSRRLFSSGPGQSGGTLRCPGPGWSGSRARVRYLSPMSLVSAGVIGDIGGVTANQRSMIYVVARSASGLGEPRCGPSLLRARARYACPRFLRFLPDLPRGSRGSGGSGHRRVRARGTRSRGSPTRLPRGSRLPPLPINLPEGSVGELSPRSPRRRCSRPGRPRT